MIRNGSSTRLQMNTTKLAIAVAPRARAASGAPPADAVREPHEPDGAGEEDAVVAGQRGQPREQPGDRERSAVALQAAGRAPDRRGDERVEDREVLGLGHE